jgi:hypothetical protein
MKTLTAALQTSVRKTDHNNNSLQLAEAVDEICILEDELSLRQE